MKKACIVIKIEVAGPAGIDVRQTGAEIKKQCMAQGLTVKQIHKELDIAFQSVYAWFAGSALPSLDNIYQLGGMLGIPVDQMIIGMHKKICFWLDWEEMEEKRAEKRIWKYYTHGLTADESEEVLRMLE